MSNHDLNEAYEPTDRSSGHPERYSASQITQAGMLGTFAVGGSLAIIETTPSTLSLMLFVGGAGLRLGGYLIDRLFDE